jgi:hypothetical protein
VSAVESFTNARDHVDLVFCNALARLTVDFRDKAPLSAADAAALILDGVRSGAWRILVGNDVRRLDSTVRAKPDAAYDYAELFRTAQHPPVRNPVARRGGE